LGKEGNVTEGMPSEPADLVDDIYARFVRPLGNLVVLFAQAEAAWLTLLVDLTGCTEKEAQRFLQKEAADLKQEILPLVRASGIEDGARQELCDSIEEFFCDRKRRNRLIHDEWYVSLFDGGVARTRGLPRDKGADVVFGESTPEDVWNLAWRFREYEHVFSHASYVLGKQKNR
jgi:hypothetical protein